MNIVFILTVVSFKHVGNELHKITHGNWKHLTRQAAEDHAREWVTASVDDTYAWVVCWYEDEWDAKVNADE